MGCIIRDAPSLFAYYNLQIFLNNSSFWPAPWKKSHPVICKQKKPKRSSHAHARNLIKVCFHGYFLQYPTILYAVLIRLRRYAAWSGPALSGYTRYKKFFFFMTWHIWIKALRMTELYHSLIKMACHMFCLNAGLPSETYNPIMTRQ